MSDDEDFEKALPQLLQTMRVITGAMCGGLAMFAGVTVFLYMGAKGKPPPPTRS